MAIALNHKTPIEQINLTEKAISGYKIIAFNMGNIRLLKVNSKV